ncbi:hypothetical protein [Streptomyces zingiberis]|uniref:Uncharacterized protein n=1 Tax=Streptomyces zingiberis TaxID=2053010 RepID=A0ABX1C4N8_9ACTN|nr:hypothetical protein [Streptomyces zingiberis]NJQ03605.1 hypothetical protein [Streptomyces zingiberis]
MPTPLPRPGRGGARAGSVRRAAVTGVTALCVLALATAPARALGSGPQGRTVSIRTDRAGAYFYHHSESLVVSDYRADGYGARAYLTWGGRKVSVYAGGGRNSTDEKRLAIAEGTPVWLQLCYTQRGRNVRCGSTHKGYA